MQTEILVRLSPRARLPPAAEVAPLRGVHGFGWVCITIIPPLRRKRTTSKVTSYCLMGLSGLSELPPTRPRQKLSLIYFSQLAPHMGRASLVAPTYKINPPTILLDILS